MPFHDDHLLETFKSLVLISIEGLKALLLVNGGAVVALLAFLGQSSLGPAIAPRATEAIGWFVGGTALSTFAFLGSYATQFALYNERVPTTYRGPRHMTFLYFTFALVLPSLGCFAKGSFSSLQLFTNPIAVSATVAPAVVAAPTQPVVAKESASQVTSGPAAPK